MPVIKKAKGYYWGTKGPFKTKKKAQAVGRAAYASRYKKKKQENNMATTSAGVSELYTPILRKTKIVKKGRSTVITGPKKIKRSK